MMVDANKILIKPLQSSLFAKFGDVIETEGAQNFEINNGHCTRFHDLANVQFSGPSARPIISLLTSEPFELPFELSMVERHPHGSQAFIPLSDNPFLVVVCSDNDGVPGLPEAFIASNRQGVNIGQNVWHGILTPLERSSDFVVFDRAGDGNNLEEYFFDQPYQVCQI